jgi:hypothetical protein
MRDDAAQACGPFGGDVPGCKGVELRHGKLIDFIARNYASDARGCWFFQNGPQRVFVELLVAPLIWRLQPDGAVHDHRGRTATIQNCWLDEEGHLFLLADTGFGLVHSQDMHLAADRIEQGKWNVQDVFQAELQARFGYVKNPQLLR